MPPRQHSQACRMTTTSADDFRYLYWKGQVVPVPAPSQDYGMREWCEKHHVWGQPLRKTDVCVKDILPTDTDIIFEKALEKFYFQRHGYLREGAIKKFLPVPEELDQLATNKVDVLSTQRGHFQEREEWKQNKNHGVCLPPISSQHVVMADMTPSSNDDVFRTKQDDECSLPQIRYEAKKYPSGTSPMDHLQSKPASASSTLISLPETSEINSLFSNSEDEEQDTDKVLKQYEDTNKAKRNAQKMAYAVDRIRSRMAKRDSRDAHKTYPSPKHKITEVNSARRVKFLTSVGNKWKPIDPKEISYLNLFAPYLDISYEGWKKYKRE